MRKLGLWLQKELDISDNYLDVVFRTSHGKYRVHQFSATWWALGMLSVTAAFLIGLMIIFIMCALH